MSVLMLLRVQGNAKGLEGFAAENPDVVQKIAARAREYGVLRHRFFGTESELFVVDEWPSPADFQRFYESSPEIPEMIMKAGITGEPSITFADSIDAGDEIG